MSLSKSWLTGLLRRVFQIVIVLLGIAIGARVVYEIMAPIAPLLSGLLVLIIIYGLIFRRFR